MEYVQVRPPDTPGDGAQAELTTSDFVECYLMHYRRLARALQLGGADRPTAEDIAQEAFARALARWRRVSRGTNPPGYVYTTAFRLLQRSQKRSARTRVGDVPEMTSPAADTNTASTIAMAGALATMPPKRRACAVMCLVVGLPVHEAGEALGITDGTVRKHLDEARRDLAEALR